MDKNGQSSLVGKAKREISSFANVLQEEKDKERRKQDARDGALFGIRDDTSDINRRIADANERISLLNKQLDDTNEELRKVRNECDTTNKQLMEHQIDCQKRDVDNTREARDANWLAILSLAVAVASFVFQVVHH